MLPLSGLATILNAPGDAGLGSLAINAYVDAFLEGEQIDWDSAPFDVIPSSWITFTLPDRPPYADPRTGAEPIRLTAIDQ